MKDISKFIRSSVLVSSIALFIPGHVYSQESAADLLVEEAYAQMEDLRAADAKATFDRGLELYPDNYRVLGGLGKYYRNLGNYSEAIRVQERAIAVAPESAGRYYQLAITLRYTRDLDRAAALLRQAIAMNPLLGNYRAQYARTEIARGNFTNAVRQLHIAEQLLGPEADTWRFAQLAMAHAQVGRRDDALRMIGVLKERDDTSDAIWALAYLAIGDYEEALARIESAIENPVGEVTPEIFSELRANVFHDPALDGAQFKRLLNGMWDPR